VLPSSQPRGGVLPLGTLIGLGLALVAVIISALVTFGSSGTRERAVESVAHTQQVLRQLETVLGFLRDAETSQRGYLLTGEDRYLGPFQNAQINLPVQLQQLGELLQDNPRQVERLQLLRQLTDEKLAELLDTTTLRQAGNLDGALAIVRSDRGRTLMDRARQVIDEMRDEESALLATRNAAWERAVRGSQFITAISTVSLLLLIGMAAIVMSRDFRSRQQQAWLRTGQVGLAARIQGEQRIDTLGEHVISYLAEYLGAAVGAVYLAEGDRFVRVAGYGIANPGDAMEPGARLIGQVARDRRPIRVSAVPADYWHVSSGTGRARPGELLIAPAIIDGTVQGVIELGFFRRTENLDRELLDRVSEILAAAIRGSRDRTRL
jgi:CHASE3 domain sensor protein